MGALGTFLLFFGHQFYFPPQLVGGFTLGGILDKPESSRAWPQMPFLLPPPPTLLRRHVIPLYWCGT